MSVWPAGAANTAALTIACRVDGSVSVISSDRAKVSSRTSGSILSASRLSCEAASRAMQLCRSAGVTVVVVSVVSSVSAASSAVSSAAVVGVGMGVWVGASSAASGAGVVSGAAVLAGSCGVWESAVGTGVAAVSVPVSGSGVGVAITTSASAVMLSPVVLSLAAMDAVLSAYTAMGWAKVPAIMPAANSHAAILCVLFFFMRTVPPYRFCYVVVFASCHYV